MYSLECNVREYRSKLPMEAFGALRDRRPRPPEAGLRLYDGAYT